MEIGQARYAVTDFPGQFNELALMYRNVNEMPGIAPIFLRVFKLFISGSRIISRSLNVWTIKHIVVRYFINYKRKLALVRTPAGCQRSKKGRQSMNSVYQ